MKSSGAWNTQHLPLNADGKPVRRTGYSFILALLLAFFAGSACTNYSGESQDINPPTILGAITINSSSNLAIIAEGSGHLIRVSVQNQELGFVGYRLYVSTSEAAVQALPEAGGTDCGPLFTQPITPRDWYIEVKPDQDALSAGYSDRLCFIKLGLNSGEFIALRSLLLKDAFGGVTTSIPSNVVMVP